MYSVTKWLVASILAGIVVAAPPAVGPSAAADRVLTGELVVLDGSPNRFRLVGHDGSFSAPAGTPLETLDGRPVQVEVDGGRVVSITEMAVRIDPVTTGWETVRGEVQVLDAAARTFTIAGMDRTFTAPPGTEVAAYAGKWVELRLDTAGTITEMKLVSAPTSGAVAPPAAPVLGAGTANCLYLGQAYSPGSTICQTGLQHRCESQLWRNLGTPCGDSPAAAGDAPALVRTCIYAGATMASGSSICRGGETLRCVDGTWVNTQAACR